MKFTIQCPTCKADMQVSYQDMADNSSKALKCCLCGDAPAPDIMTAYKNLGKTITELYGCCQCSDADTVKWLPREVKL